MTDLVELRNNILTEMYAEAEPPLDFMEALENADELDEDWYSQHYLPADECQRIYDEHTEDVYLTRAESTHLSLTCLTSLAPTSEKPDDE